MPGLLALIVFACFNNFLGGAFMALMDAYGLSLVSVQAWGLLWGALSVGIIVGGLVVARTGLTSNPVRILMLVNVVLWSVTTVFAVRSSIVLLAIGMAIYMLLVPFAEAAEQTVLQQLVTRERTQFGVLVSTGASTSSGCSVLGSARGGLRVRPA